MLVPIRPGVRGMGDAIDDILAGSDSADIQSSSTVDASSSFSPSAGTPTTVWTSSSTSLAPTTNTASGVGSPSIGVQILSAIFGPSKAMTSNLTAAQLAALKAQQGPSTALIIGGLAVGALVIGLAMRRQPAAST